jgi:hypothetical protein
VEDVINDTSTNDPIGGENDEERRDVVSRPSASVFMDEAHCEPENADRVEGVSARSETQEAVLAVAATLRTGLLTEL